MIESYSQKITTLDGVTMMWFTTGILEFFHGYLPHIQPPNNIKPRLSLPYSGGRLIVVVDNVSAAAFFSPLLFWFWLSPTC